MSARVAFGPISISFHVPILVPPSLPIICFPHFRSLITFYIHDPNQSRFWPLLQRTPSTDVLRAKFLFFPISSLRFVYGTLEFNSLEAWRACSCSLSKAQEADSHLESPLPLSRLLAFSTLVRGFVGTRRGRCDGAAEAGGATQQQLFSVAVLLCFIW